MRGFWMCQKRESGEKLKTDKNAQYVALRDGWVAQHWYQKKYHLPAGSDPVLHYLQKGWKRGYDPSPTVSTTYCKDRYKDQIPTEVCPIAYIALHPLEKKWVCSPKQDKQREQIAATALFDWDWYEAEYFPAGAGQQDLVLHYLWQGGYLGYAPSALFEPQFYFSQLKPDFYDGTPLLLHYLNHGKQESLAFFSSDTPDYQRIKQSPLFDAEWYHKQYMPGNSDIDAAWFYLRAGDARGHNPSLLFDRERYRVAVDARGEKVQGNTLLHYLNSLTAHQEEQHPIPPGMSRESILASFSGMRYLAAQEKQLQNEALPTEYSQSTSQLIVYLVPLYTSVTGGILSIAQLAQDTIHLKECQDAAVMIATLPADESFFSYPTFDCPLHVFRFYQLADWFENLQSLVIHIPELYLEFFLQGLREQDLQWMQRISRLHFNILNQNIKLMPQPEVVRRLQMLGGKVTQTVAHAAYCNREMRDRYGVPLHRLIAHKHSKYALRSYSEKEQLLAYSPDDNPYKQQVLQLLAKEFTKLKLREIRNLKYEEYLELISRAKWVITFGEGRDAYFVQPFLSGGISFAVYNEDFFLPEQKSWPTVFESYEAMLVALPQRMRELDEKAAYMRVNAQMAKIFSTDRLAEQHIQDLAAFYQGDYTYP